MSGFFVGENRYQSTLFPERIDDYVGEDSAARVIDVFIDRLDLSGLGFKTEAADTGRPVYNPATLLKIFVYGYMNKVHSSRRLEADARRNLELPTQDSHSILTKSHFPEAPPPPFVFHFPSSLEASALIFHVPLIPFPRTI